MGIAQSSIQNDIKLDSFQLDLANQVLEQLQECGQSGLEVMTSGGKSFIAAHIMYEYVNKHHDTHIMWMAPKAAINNVKNKIFSNKAIANSIVYVGYEELSRGSVKTEDIKEFDKIGLIVFDECHKALAKQTYKYLSELLTKLDDADRLAMSATPVRYGGLNTFTVLVPKVTSHIKFDISDAGAHDLLPGLEYIVGNTQISATDFKILDEFKKLTRNNIEAEELYKEVMNTLHSFKFDLEKDLGEMLKDHLNGCGEYGERHIAFFRSIQQLQEMKSAIKGAFEYAYPDCKINILEYHSGMSNADNDRAFNQFVIDEPENKRIDVMLSVDKATESIHPDNIRSVIMFRGTNSVRVYLQQLGRGLMLKSYHPDDIAIFDLAENVSCLGNQSIYIGRQSPSNRQSISDSDNSQTIDEVRLAIMHRFGYTKGLGLTTKIGLKRIQDCIDKLKNIQRLADIKKIRENLKRVKNIFNSLVASGMSEPTENIHQMMDDIAQEISIKSLPLKRIWSKDEASFNTFWTNMHNTFTTYQKIFLSDGADVDRTLIDTFNELGHSAYLTAMNRKVANDMLNDIDYIAKELEKCGDMSNSTNNHAKHKLKSLRLSFAKNLVGSSICVYARRKGVNIEMTDIKMQDIVSLAETDRDKVIIQEFKSVIRQLANIDQSIDNGDSLQYKDWLVTLCKLTVTNRKFREDEMSYICNKYIQNKYGYILTAYKLPQHIIEHGNRLMAIVFKIRNNEYTNKIEEDYIFDHSGTNNMSDYEIGLLNELGISKRDYADKIESHTTFMESYELAMNGNMEAIKKMLEYNRANLDERRKKLLNTTAFRQIRNQTKGTLGAEVLLKKAKLMYDRNGDYRKMYSEFNDALKQGTIEQLDLVLSPFKPHEAELAKQVITCSEADFQEMVESDQVNSLSILINRCKETASCSRDIMENILKISQLQPSYKTRLREICQQIDMV